MNVSNFCLKYICFFILERSVCEWLGVGREYIDRGYEREGKQKGEMERWTKGDRVKRRGELQKDYETIDRQRDHWIHMIQQVEL